MTIVNQKSKTLMISLQILFISIGVVSIAVILNLYFPAIVEFAVKEVPAIWNCVASWLKPPYLYFIINGIIITIVAFQHWDGDEKPEVLTPAMDMAADIQPGVYLPCEARISKVEMEADKDEFVIARSPWTPPARNDSTEIPTEYTSPAEKPLVSVRFGHPKSVKANPEGKKALRRVARPKRHETLENTWKMITEGRQIPLTRHLKKSDTWEHHDHQINPNPDSDPTPSPQKVKKLDTFKDRANDLPPAPPAAASPTAVRLRKEPSLGQGELNRRVEAFIKKFNEEMRLQKQESLNQYYEMINRSAH